MEDLEMINLWKAYDQRLTASLSLNRQNLVEITALKVQSLLKSMKPIKIFTLLVGLCWVVFVDLLLVNLWQVANPFFLVSAGIQVLLTKLAIGIYAYQLFLLDRVDVAEPVLAVQKTIASLTLSTLWSVRLLFLQLPVWTTFYWNAGMLENGNPLLWSVQVLVTLLFMLGSVWLFWNVRLENRDKKWFKLIFQGKEWMPLHKAQALLEEVAEYK